MVAIELSNMPDSNQAVSRRIETVIGIRADVLRNAALIVWGTAMIASFIWLCAYSNTAGAIEAAPERLDTVAKFDDLVEQESKLLFLFVHPRCPCTWATARQLDRIVRGHSTPCRILTYAFYPTDQSAEELEVWRQTRLLAFLATIPNTEIVDDVGGAEALRNGAFTSGTVLFYDDGILKFQGGITSTRGHEGDAIGSDAIANLLANQKPARSDAPVFGCPLFP